jgi:hypothetical protein
VKTKEKTPVPAKSRVQKKTKVFSEMKESDMTAIDRKIHDLLISEGYRSIGSERFEGMQLNNYTNVNRVEYLHGERDRVFVITHGKSVGGNNES